MAESELAELGRQLIAEGRLLELRLQLGLTRNAMAEMLHVSPLTYASWENRAGEVRPWKSLSERVARFHQQAIKELEVLAEHGISLVDLVPFYVAATLLGIPQELLLRRYRNNEFEAIDTGILGLWIPRDELKRMTHR